VEAVVESLQVVVEAVGDQCEVVVAAGVEEAENRLVERAATACLLEVGVEGIQEACQVSVACAYRVAYAFRGEAVP
jgi:hypothetical protein